ncbi:DUF7507 domain-containing protein, partial [Pararhodonellum marinum]
IASLAPGATETFTVTYTITQADIDNGSFTNTATATDDSGDATGTDSVTVNSDAEGSLEVIKTSDVTTFFEAGDVVNYTILVRNNGIVAINNITVTDPITGLDTNIASLAPGDEETFTETYTITEADVANGFVLNIATAQGVDGLGETVTASDNATVTLEGIVDGGSVLITKSANVSSYSEEGDEIVYTITVRNNGTVALTNVTVTDPLTGLDTTIPNLPANSEQVFTETYTVNASDITNGNVTNTANVQGVDPNGDLVEGSASAVVTLEGIVDGGSIEVTKTANVSNYAEEGDEIVYTITVRNNGTVDLTNVTV